MDHGFMDTSRVLSLTSHSRSHFSPLSTCRLTLYHLHSLSFVASDTPFVTFLIDLSLDAIDCLPHSKIRVQSSSVFWKPAFFTGILYQKKDLIHEVIGLWVKQGSTRVSRAKGPNTIVHHYIVSFLYYKTRRYNVTSARTVVRSSWRSAILANNLDLGNLLK